MAAERVLWILCLGQILGVGALPSGQPTEGLMNTELNCCSLFLVLCSGSGSGLEKEEVWNGGEKCEKPCSGESCVEMAALMEHLVDFTVDPCDDFFAFACSAKTRGNPLPVTPIILEDEESLVKSPPQGYAYIKKFYLKCLGKQQSFR